MKLNVVMIAKNEERCLAKCLEKVSPLADRIILADTGSSDSTKEIAKKWGAEVFDFTWIDDFSAARNAALARSDADWNLILDADEYLHPIRREELEEQIRTISGQYPDGWLGGMTRWEEWQQGGHCEKSIARIPRLLPSGVRYTGTIHEQPDAPYPIIMLRLEADHDGYLQEGKGIRNLAYLQKELEAHPDDPYYAFQMGYTLRNLGRLPESLNYFRRFYQLRQAETGYWAEGVILYLYTLLDLESDETLQEAWQILAEEEGHLRGIPDYWFVCGIFYTNLVCRNPEQYMPYFSRIGLCYENCLKLGEADAIVTGTGSFKAEYNLGLYDETRGEKQSACRHYRRAAELGFAQAERQLEQFLSENVKTKQ